MHGKFTLISFVLLSLPALADPAQDSPPGLVFVEGGKTQIGTKLKDVEKLVAKHKQVANTLAGETPQHFETVDDFFLMPNEVTNEQYAEFVRSTTHMPPYYWGSSAIDDGRRAFLETQGKAAAAALKAGKRIEREKFDAAEWWAKNWTGLDWGVPADRLDSPVNYVSYHDVEAYCRWAGLRMMTESEFQRAARGKSENIYPWGNDWDLAKCNSLEFKDMDRGMPVGSFENGASGGVYDLAGNVWEWTSTKYLRYDGYKPLSVKVGRETIEGLAGFDPTLRVIVGGGYTVQGFGCRISVRQGLDRSQTTEALGFRCAADAQRGSDSARWVLGSEVDLSLIPSDVSFAPSGTAVLQRWETAPGTSNVPGYAVIKRYERSLFCPIVELKATSKIKLTRDTTENGPRILGFFSFEQPLSEPEIDGGVYYLAWRAAAKVKQLAAEEGDVAEAGSDKPLADDEIASINFWEVPGFDETIDCMFFYDTAGDPVVAWPSREIVFGKPAKGSSGRTEMRFEAFVPPTEKPAKDAPPIVPLDTLRFSFVIAAGRKALMTDVAFKIRPGLIDDSWQ